jgi:TetR/AcrR family transcriptional regulator
VREDIRERLLDAALVEFGDKGFDGASTRAIARSIGAHQPQINYHFASKQALWTAAVDHLFDELAASMRELAVPARSSRVTPSCTASWCTKRPPRAIASPG